MSRTEILSTVTGTWIAESTKAVRFKVTQVGAEVLETPVWEWFPQSQIRKLTKDPKIADQDTLVVTEWILRQKGLI